MSLILNNWALVIFLAVMETTSQSSAAVAPQSNPLVTKVKALLMRAWRERWNEIQWGVQLKKVIAVTPGDSKELAGG